MSKVLLFNSTDLDAFQKDLREFQTLNQYNMDVASVFDVPAPFEQPKFDDSGNPVIDESGNQVMETIQPPRPTLGCIFSEEDGLRFDLRAAPNVWDDSTEHGWSVDVEISKFGNKGTLTPEALADNIKQFFAQLPQEPHYGDTALQYHTTGTTSLIDPPPENRKHMFSSEVVIPPPPDQGVQP